MYYKIMMHVSTSTPFLPQWLLQQYLNVNSYYDFSSSSDIYFPKTINAETYQRISWMAEIILKGGYKVGSEGAWEARQLETRRSDLASCGSAQQCHYGKDNKCSIKKDPIFTRL